MTAARDAEPPPALRRIRVLHLCETAQGGVGTYIDTLTRLERGQVDSRVVLPDAHQAMLAPMTPRRSFRYLRRSVGSMLRLLVAALREGIGFRPDIVFCHSTFALLALAVLRPVSPGTRFIYCAHGWAGARESAKPRRRALVRGIEGRLCGLAHRVVNVAQADLAHATAHGYRGRHMLIENAVRPLARPVATARLSGPDAAIHLLFVGRLDRQKGLDLLLAAFAQARAANPMLRLHVIGAAVVAPDLRPGADAPDAGVSYLGWIGADGIDAYYAAADLLVIPSRWEGLPLVLPEALRNGTPAMVSDRSALPTLIEEGVTGFALPLEVDAFARALTALDKPRLAAMRPACLAQFHRRYHADRLGREILAVYHDLCPR